MNIDVSGRVLRKTEVVSGGRLHRLQEHVQNVSHAADHDGGDQGERDNEQVRALAAVAMDRVGVGIVGNPRRDGEIVFR
jgi:hypothetical protein